MNDKITLAVLGQKLDDLKEDVNEIKKHTGKINGCIRSNELAIRTIDTTLTGHLGNHKRDLVLLTIFLTIIGIIIGLVFRLAGG